MKQLIGDLRKERQRSKALEAELQALRECDHQSCGQLKALLAANTDLAGRNTQLEQENASLLVGLSVQLARWQRAGWLKHGCVQGLTELLLDQLPGEADTSPSCDGWAGSPSSCSGPLQDDSREAGEAAAAEQDDECSSAAPEPASEELLAGRPSASDTSSPAGQHEQDQPQTQGLT